MSCSSKATRYAIFVTRYLDGNWIPFWPKRLPILCEATKRSIKMASSKSLITVFFVVVLITLIEPVKSRKCTVIKTGLPCTKHCCGQGPYIFTCTDDCKGIACDRDGDCGDDCCKYDKCEDCPSPTHASHFLSKTVIIIIAVCAMVFVVKADFHSVQFSERSILCDRFLLKCV